MMLTEFCPRLPARPLSSARHCRGERRIRALWSTLIPPTLHPPLCVTPTLTQKCDALQCFTLRQIPPAVYSLARKQHAGRDCYIIQPSLKVDGCFSIMLKSLFVYGVLGVLLIPAKCAQISVCVENDNDLRVDCQIEPKPNKINSYEFSWSTGTKESLIHTNVSGSSADSQFSGKSQVEELEPYGYRMTLTGFTDTLPHNTTYMCKISGTGDRITVEREQLVPCSAVSVFLKSSCSWIVCLLLFFCQTRS